MVLFFCDFVKGRLWLTGDAILQAAPIGCSLCVLSDYGAIANLAVPSRLRYNAGVALVGVNVIVVSEEQAARRSLTTNH